MRYNDTRFARRRSPGAQGAEEGKRLIDLATWLNTYREAVLSAFGARVRFIGLQGSRARGEARAESDIDMVLILDRLEMEDLQRYRALCARLPDAALLCGFVAGAEELVHWDRADRFQFWFDTRPLYDRLERLLPPPTRADAARAASLGACNLYHACCHNYLHGGDAEALRALYQSARFVLQAAAYARSGRYAADLSALRACLRGREREVLEVAEAAIGGACPACEPATRLLMEWAGTLIRQTAEPASQE